MYLHKTPSLARLFFPRFWWKRRTDDKIIYLTFDDGPIPGVTEWVLETLRQYDAKATFFCVGQNVEEHPDVYRQVLTQGHAVGNHTFNHLNGWKTPPEDYLENIRACDESLALDFKLNPSRPLFRPPYGRLTRRQSKLAQQQYQIVMWDVLSGDFDQSLSPALCLRKTIEHTQSGSIVTFHDSLKAKDKLEYVLPRYLDHFAALHYRFESL
jgi:peptidoglycan/xylan/chitin deacetylase (PgdA/CDA1 family)